MIGGIVQCISCKHFRSDIRDRTVCGAFPKGIPFAIIASRHNHRKPYPGDNGILYEPKETPPQEESDAGS